VDIRDKNEFEFVCPYGSVLPWRTAGASGASGDSPYGFIAVTVLNTLQCPDTVS